MLVAGLLNGCFLHVDQWASKETTAYYITSILTRFWPELNDWNDGKFLKEFKELKRFTVEDLKHNKNYFWAVHVS